MTETRYYMPQRYEAGIIDPSKPPAHITIEDLIEHVYFRQGAYEDRLRCLDMLGLPFPPQVTQEPVEFRGRCYDDLATVVKASHRYQQMTRVNKREPVRVTRGGWRNGLRPDGRKTRVH